MTLAPGTWLMAPDGTLIHLWRTHGSGESFADHSDKFERVIHPTDDENDRCLSLEFSGDVVGEQRWWAWKALWALNQRLSTGSVSIYSQAGASQYPRFTR